MASYVAPLIGTAAVQGPTSKPDDDAQVATNNPDGSFVGWVTPGDVYADGVAGGQTIHGGPGPGDDLVLSSTSDSTKGKVRLGQGDRLYMSSAVGEDSVRLREVNGATGWVFSSGGVDRWFLNGDTGAFGSPAVNTQQLSGLQSINMAGNGANLVMNDTLGLSGSRIIHQSEGVVKYRAGLHPSGSWSVEAVGHGSVLRVNASGEVVMPNLPTADPLEAGVIWDDNGTLKISQG